MTGFRTRPPRYPDWALASPAEHRAYDLLWDRLTPAQQDDLQCTGIISHGRWRIRLGYYAARVSDVLGNSWCISCGTGLPDSLLPIADQALALLLLLRANEQAFRTTANYDRTWPRP